MVEISIIIPVYNAEKTLKDTVNSVLQQDFTDWEIIFVNDGSTDASGTLCDEYVANDSRFRVIHQQNGGVSSARNIGISCARGKYIVFMDADDAIAPGCFSKIYSLIEQHNADIAIGTMEIIDMCTGERKYTECQLPYEQTIDRRGIVKHFLEAAFLKNERPSNTSVRYDICSGLYRTEFIIENNLNFAVGQAIGEDYRFALDALSKANSVICSQTPFRIYNYYSNLVSSKYALAMGNATTTAFNYQINLIKENNLRKECYYNAVGSAWVGINTYVQAMYNRRYTKKEIYKWLYQKINFKCMFSVLCMSDKHRKFADISKKDIVVAFLYLIGAYKKALQFNNK